MTTMNSRLIPLTDHKGDPLIPDEDLFEPNKGSVVLTEGLFGTAWQRHFSDGLWHSSRGGSPRPWRSLRKKRNLVLVYDAEERGAQAVHRGTRAWQDEAERDRAGA